MKNEAKHIYIYGDVFYGLRAAEMKNQKHGFMLFWSEFVPLFNSVAAVINIALIIAFFMLFNKASDGQHDFDVLSISITILEIFLVVIAVFGFWTIRGAAIEKAEKVADEAATRIANSKVNQILSGLDDARQAPDNTPSDEIQPSVPASATEQTGSE